MIWNFNLTVEIGMIGFLNVCEPRFICILDLTFYSRFTKKRNDLKYSTLNTETDKEVYRQELLNKPMRVQIAGLPCTVIILLSE